MDGYNLTELLDHVDPSLCTYTEWCACGMALKQEGYTVADWAAWSRRDSGRYHEGECERKWNTFHGSREPVTGGTIYQLAVNQGWNPQADIQGGMLDWDAVIKADGRVIDPGWVESKDVHKPQKWDPAREVIRYIEALFEPSETVGYVMKSWQNEKGKYVPKSAGAWKTAGELIEKLEKCKGDIGAVFDDYDPKAGAWVRFNPLDGQGAKNANVTEYRYALVESDTIEIEKQNALLRELELPIAVLVHSGGKSLHAIVRIDAPDYTEYRKRVDFLYSICKKNGLVIDTQNRNPSRLSRLPGCTRGENKQYIVDVNIGKATWAEWKEWVESVNDDLPDFENLEDVWSNLPAKAPELIKGVLREGHKMLIVGGSKTGKSFLQIELSISIAEGLSWLGWECAKGRVLYVNLELDRASCLQRFKDVYTAMGVKPKGLGLIDIWNLRGSSENMKDLVPKLVRRAKKHKYKAIIIDPIYKVLTGDENSAEQMALFCNQFDRICKETGAAVIYCHHHSKGSQGGKRSMDRASGSGVFARDPDALLDFIELPLDDKRKNQLIRNAQLDAAEAFIRKTNPELIDKLPVAQDCAKVDDYVSAVREAAKYLAEGIPFQKAIKDAKEEAEAMTALRVDGTLREFRKFNPRNMWFKFPIHVLDETGTLQDINPEDEGRFNRQKNLRKRPTKAERQAENNEAFDTTFAMLDTDSKGLVSVDDLADSMGVSVRTIKRRASSQPEKYLVDSAGTVHLIKK